MIAESAAFSSEPIPRVPGWLLVGAFMAGMIIAVGSLSYAPQGRLNVLWLWLLWAGLPLLGSLVSLWVMFWGDSQPWLFRWRGRHLHWHPSRRERLQMMIGIQHLWLWAGGGLLLGYLVLLLFTDLAFGWSSTLINQPEPIVHVSQLLASPWGWLWPAAMPSDDLVAATRYARIEPQAGEVARAGDWWRFLLMSLLCYNLLPRGLLLGLLKLRLRGLQPQTQAKTVGVRAPVVLTAAASSGANLKTDTFHNWRSIPVVGWELLEGNCTPATCLNLGLGDWQQDERALRQYLSSSPERLRWQVNANRSPVGELGDLIAIARAAGVKEQGLEPVMNHTTDMTRHVASWRAFARKHQLVWLEATPL